MHRANQMWVHSEHAWLVILIAQLVVVSIGGDCRAESGEQQGTLVNVVPGAVNGVCIERNGHRLVIYGDPQQRWKSADMVLFTHSRRDVVWAGQSLVKNGAQCVNQPPRRSVLQR